jgi:hypothetical protein
MKQIFALLLVLPLAGCLSTQEAVAKREAAIKQQQTELAAADNAACTKYGFTPGSKEFATCMMTLDRNRKALGASL